MVACPPPVLRKRYRGTILLLGLGIFLGAGTLPFIFESQSLMYKFGIHKTWLRTGKVLGTLSWTALGLQLLLVARVGGNIWGQDRLVGVHKNLGTLICCLIPTHAFFILAGDDFAGFPLERRYWPEYTGVATAFILLATGIVARGRRLLDYHLWRRAHGLVAAVILGGAALHFMQVSDPFKTGDGRPLALASSILWGGLLLTIYRRRLWPFSPVIPLEKATALGKDIIQLNLATPLEKPSPMPGQFAFITSLSPGVPRQEHPITIASPPGRPLSFIIRQEGKWSQRLSTMAPGGGIRVDGPHGLFSTAAHPQAKGWVFLAGGIGITPFLSMLWAMAETQDPRPLTLVWLVKQKGGLTDLLDPLAGALPQLEHKIYQTRSPGEGRPEKGEILSRLDGIPRDHHCFICGPPSFMDAMAQLVKNTKFKHIHQERFSL